MILTKWLFPVVFLWQCVSGIMGNFASECLAAAINAKPPATHASQNGYPF